MAVPFVKQCSNSTVYFAASSLACSFSSAVASNALICVFVHTKDTINVSLVSDTVNGAYTQAGTYQGGAGRMSLWYKLNSASGTPTITVTLATASHFAIWAGEYAAVDSLNDTSSSSGTSTAPSTTSITVNAAGDLCVAAYGGTSESIQATTPASPFVYRHQYAVSDNSRTATLGVWGSVVDDTAAPASEAASWTIWDSVAWVAFGASFRVAASPPPPTPPPPIYRRKEVGPPLLGMPWTTQLPLRPMKMAVLPPPPPPPTPPPPPVPPPPPGVPPVPPVPPSPPPGTDGASVLSLPREADLPPTVRRHLEQSASIWNSLFRTQQVVPVRMSNGQIEYVVVATYARGLTGVYPP